jgi:hypothetical protein
MISNIPNINTRRQIFIILIRGLEENLMVINILNINPRRQLFVILIRGFRGEPHGKHYSKYQSQETALYRLEEQS